MMDDNGEVIGDLPLAQLEPSYKSGKPNSQVKELLALQEKLFKAFDNNHGKTGNSEAITDSLLHKEGMDNLNLSFGVNKKTPFVVRVKQVMKGVIPFTKNEKNTLNEVVQDSSLELCVRVTGNDVATSRGSHERHPEIVVPHVGSIGQPYMLIPAPSGEKIAVPFYMVPFDAEKHKNTELYKLVCNAVANLAHAGAGTSQQHVASFKKHMDVLEGLLQVKRVEGSSVVEVKDGKFQIHLQSLTDPENMLNFEVPSTGNTAQDAIALVNQMSGIPINVSLQFINQSIETGTTNETKRRASYNRVIGEIADVNLPKGTRHTVNGWFTVELNPNGNINRNPVRTKTTGVYTENIGGRNVEIDTDKLVAIDPMTGEQIDDDEDINLLLAQIKANKPQYKDKDFIQIQIGGDLRTYDVKNNRFVNKKPSMPTKGKRFAPEVPKTEETPAAPQLAAAPQEEQTPEPEPQRKELSKEQLEKEMKDAGVLGRQTRDAWNSIPDELKMKMANEGAVLVLEYDGKSESISYADKKTLSTVLKSAQIAAKKGTLTVREGVKPMEKSGVAITREKERKARQWLSKNLPMLSNEERTQFVERIARGGKNAGKMWGSYRNGVVEIQRNAPMGTIYHEAFHYVVDMVLDPEEKRALLAVAKQEYGMTDDYMAEERLAEDFRRYSLDENASGIVGRIKRWIRKIVDKMTRYNRISDAAINQLFWKINNGELANKSVEVENFEKQQQRVLMEIRNVQKEKRNWDNLPRSTKESLKNAGLSEDAYRKMSLEEKEQYIMCRG